MNEFSVGDRVDVSDLIGTIVSLDNNICSNLNSNHQENNLFSQNGSNTPNLINNSEVYRTLVIEWDDLTKGEFDHNSKRLNKLKNNKLTILTHINDENRRNGEISNDHNYSEVSKMINERFLVLDSYKPCSFVKMNQIDFGISFEEAFKSKYLFDKENVNNIEMEDSDRVYEFVGLDSAFDFFSNSSKLFIMDLSGMKISKLGTIEEFPKCLELYINNNLLNSLKINKILEKFSKLQILDVSNNKIDLPIESTSISTLVINNCYFEFETVLKTLDKSKNIQNLVMCNNLINEIDYFCTKYPLVKTVDLSRNYIYKWETISTLLELFPNLNKLSLENNYIHTVKSSEGYTFLNLLELDLSNNLIEDLNELVKISQMFPNLTRLKVNFNPLNLMCMVQNGGPPDQRFNGLANKLNSKIGNFNNSNSSKELIRMFIIVTFPNLTVLNGTTITHPERTNSERYLANISTKSDPKSPGTMPTTTKIKVMLIPDGDSDSFKYKPIEKNLMESYTVLDLKLLCSSLFKMNLKDIKLIYNSKMMPLCEELDDDSADLHSYGISDGYEIRVQNRRILL